LKRNKETCEAHLNLEVEGERSGLGGVSPRQGEGRGSTVVGRRAGATRRGGLAAGAACGMQTLSVIAKAAPQLGKEYRSHDEKRTKQRAE
jgi:hypothetical protein